MKRLVAVPVAGVFAAAAVLLLFHVFTYLDQLNSDAYDFTLRLAGPVPPASPTLIVAFDEDSLSRYPWPWSRDKFARIVEQVGKSKPRALALDLLLEEAT